MNGNFRRTWLLAGLSVLSGTAWPQAPSPPAPPLRPAVWDADEQAAIQCLRGLRQKERPGDDELARRLSRAGDRLGPFFFDILATRRVPALGETEAPQVLSEVQERVILLALACLDRALLLAHVELALAVETTVPRRHAALGCIGAVGRANDLPALFDLALANPEAQPDPHLRAALRRAVTSVCKRDARAIEQLVTLRRVTNPVLLPDLVRAAGDTHDPRALAYLSEIAYWYEDLALDVMSQVPAVGPSGDEGIDQAMRVRLRSYLDERQVAHCRSAITGLTALGDQEAIGALIPLLESQNAGLVQSAHWALRQLTGLLLPAEAKAWERWHQSELFWLVRFKPQELQRLRNHDPAYVASALSQLLAHPLAHRELASALPDLLQNRAPSLRILACRALAQVDAKEAVEKLVWALEDTQPDVVAAAHDALCRLTDLELPAEPQAWQAATRSKPRATQP